MGMNGANKLPGIGGMPKQNPMLQKDLSKKIVKKPVPGGGNKAGQPKSPAVKKQKEITYVKLLVTQQQFKADNKPIDDTKDEDLADLPVAPVEIDEEPVVEDKPVEEDE